MPVPAPGAHRPSSASTWNRLAVRLCVPMVPRFRTAVSRSRAAARPAVEQSASRGSTRHFSAKIDDA